jgi:hypothetical protein
MTMKALKKGLAAAFLAVAMTGCDQAPQPPAQPAATYYVDVDLRQSHSILFSDLDQHMKDAMNAVDFALPTSKARYQQLHEGEDLVDAFRAASFWISGTIGDTKLSVKDLPPVNPTADSSSCRVELELRQSHFNLSLSDHIKDAANAVKFDWDVPGDVYNNMKVGDDLIENGFRTGSFVMNGSVGNWHLKVLEKKGPCTP